MYTVNYEHGATLITERYTYLAHARHRAYRMSIAYGKAVVIFHDRYGSYTLEYKYGKETSE